MLKDTITSLITPLQESAISVIRISGDDAIAIANNLFTKDLESVDSHTVHYGYIKDPLTHKTVDEVLVSVFKAPKTYTREDVVEISCHGGILVTKEILNLVYAQGARQATNGEFTQRAFLNGRIDLSQAEGVMSLIQAENDFAKEFAISSVRGSVKKLITPFLDRLLEIIATIEVNIDYPEYDDVEMLTQETVLPRAKALMSELDRILKESKSGKILSQGIKTVILGKPNVGKSSLLNQLLEEDKAIVTDIAGTTRDLVEGHIRLENIALHLIDTAGLRDTEDKIEQIGIEKSKKALDEAEFVIVVLDSSKELDEQDKEILELTKDKERLIIYNKKDLVNNIDDNKIYVSALNHDIKDLIEAINKKFEVHTKALTTPTLSNERHIAAVQACYLAMQRAIESLEFGFELDLVTIDFNEAYTELASIIMLREDIDILGEIFSRFCLGK